MARSHGKNRVILINGADLGSKLNQDDWTRKPDISEVTTYGLDDKVYDGGLRDGTSSVTGIYDTSVTTGPRAILESLEGLVATMIDRPEGTGVGKPQRSVQVVVGQYKETNSVADFKRWTCDFQHSGPVTRTVQ